MSDESNHGIALAKHPLEEKFWARTKRRAPDECWLWGGSSDRRGYGLIWVKRRRRRATHVSWEIEHGASFPDGLMACHSCDNPACVNPAHIWAGTMSENILDCVSKGRHVPARSPWNRGITHCIKGHEFTEENTYVTASGGRTCRICMRRHRERYRKAARAKMKAARDALTDKPDAGDG